MVYRISVNRSCKGEIEGLGRLICGEVIVKKGDGEEVEDDGEEETGDGKEEDWKEQEEFLRLGLGCLPVYLKGDDGRV